MAKTNADMDEVCSENSEVSSENIEVRYEHIASMIRHIGDSSEVSSEHSGKSRESKQSGYSIDYKTLTNYDLRKQPFSNEYKKKYISTVTTYWVLRLATDSKVRTFKIRLFDKEQKSFGDAVVNIEYQDARNSVLKSSNDTDHTSFGIRFRFIRDYMKDIDSFNEGYFSYTEFINHVDNIENAPKTLIVFTTARATGNTDKVVKVKTKFLQKTNPDCNNETKDGPDEVTLMAKPAVTNKMFFFNTLEDNDHMYVFSCKDKVYTIPQIYMCTYQKHKKKVEVLIRELISRLFNVDKPNLHTVELIRWIEHWSSGELGGSYELDKEEVLIKLGYLTLSKFKIPPSITRSSGQSNYEKWRKALNSADVTVLHKHPKAVDKICESLNDEVETRLFDFNIQTFSKNIDVQNIIESNSETVVNTYLSEETLGQNIKTVSLEAIHSIFWKTGHNPLLLQVNNFKEQKFVLDVIYVLKSNGLTRNYILITAVEDIRPTLMYYNSKLKFFYNLDDVVHILPLETIKIKVTETFSLNLKDIRKSDKIFQKSITVLELFDMIQDRYSFKFDNDVLTRKDGQILQLVLNENSFQKLRNAKLKSKSTNPNLRRIPPSVYDN